MKIVIGRYVIETTIKFKDNEEIINFVLEQYPMLDKSIVSDEVKKLKLFNDTDGTIKESNESENTDSEINSRSLKEERFRKNK
jgi:hypothetical protein